MDQISNTSPRVRRVVIILICALFVLWVLPNTAVAATGPVTIDVGEFELQPSVSVDNSADAATDSQWTYSGATHTLTLLTKDGDYTITGLNSQLKLVVPAAAQGVLLTLDNPSISNQYQPCLEIYTKTTVESSWASFYAYGASCIVIFPTGELIFNQGFLEARSEDWMTGDGGYGCELYPDSSLSIGGRLALSGTKDVGGAINTDGTLTLSTTGVLTLENNSSTPLVRTIIRGGSPVYLWKLTGSATTTDALDSASIIATIPPHSTGIIQFELPPAPAPPSISGPASKTVTVGYGSLSVGPFTVGGYPAPNVTVISNPAFTWNPTTQRIDIAAGLTPGTYVVTLVASNGLEPDASMTFTLIVLPKTAPQPPHPGGEDKLPDMGDLGHRTAEIVATILMAVSLGCLTMLARRPYL